MCQIHQPKESLNMRYKTTYSFIFLPVFAVMITACNPVPQVNLDGFDLARGEEVYNSLCVACHAAAVFNAPKLGDRSTWAPRVEQGIERLFYNSINGFNAMPARGGNPNISDQDIKNAVSFMVSKVQ
jgi:cytochrome c5